jgi:membrane protein implicated in regulation of membrane protease activity
VLFQSFFDPGHGLLSSFDERAVAATAFGFLAAVGLLAARLDVPSTPAVCSGLVAFVVGVVALAPPVYAGEWHYALLAAVPVVLAGYRGWWRPDPAPDPTLDRPGTAR